MILIGVLLILSIILLVISCLNNDRFKNNKIYNISLAYPTEKFYIYNNVRTNEKKNNLFSYIIPGKSKYNFTKEIDYIKHYSQCYFALTYKKDGWDCLRHYEIIAAGCIPYFLDIDKIPLNIMNTYPKKLIKEAMNLNGLPTEEYLKNYIKKNDKLNLTINFNNFDFNNYYKLRKKILEYFQYNCLTNILSKNKLKFKETYVISRDGRGPQDYMRDLFIISLLENNQKVYTNFNIDYIFNDYNKDTTLLYGRGMTYTKCLDKNLKKNYEIINNYKFKNNTNVLFTTKSNLKRLNINNFNIPSNCFLYELDGNDTNDVDKSTHNKTIKKFIRENI